ncbi:hypothetical protein [Novosphingobium pentaromativorans]|uniref:Uncharacterized protein n=1 Tax=Novosphingobium pentaromativorans US6-1 TaxID=1088721 RepID=G6E9M5_9SPHN|nr:hypothetical protein [Novosphingobium pentaromativorans]AIT80971.1 hypothetical protein JI59_14880 [Novosphingobium pentaromativorans US6-1]EHJ62042.1 hypothetical protein NSU_1046 [Novosphingobium pentaromativorans US6-1]
MPGTTQILGALLGAVTLGTLAGAAIPTAMKPAFGPNWRDRYGVRFNPSAATYYVEAGPEDLSPPSDTTPRWAVSYYPALPPSMKDDRDWLEDARADAMQYASYTSDLASGYRDTVSNEDEPVARDSDTFASTAASGANMPAHTAVRELKVDTKAEAAVAAAARAAGAAVISLPRLSGEL